MKIWASLLLAVVLTGCVTPPTREPTYVARYRTWRASVETELASGYSKVQGDSTTLSYLAANAADNMGFLRHELASDMFCVLVLNASPLRSQLPTSTSGLQDQQQAWLKTLK